jgi:GAF domain-containing protein
MLREGIPIGVIALTQSTVRPFTAKQIELVQTFADQAVIAIENVRLFEAEQRQRRELKESLEYQTAISDVLEVISRSPSNVQPVLDTITKTAQRLCGSEQAYPAAHRNRALSRCCRHRRPSRTSRVAQTESTCAKPRLRHRPCGA